MNFLIALFRHVPLPIWSTAETAIPSTEGGKSPGNHLHILSGIKDSSFLEVVSFSAGLFSAAGVQREEKLLTF